MSTIVQPISNYLFKSSFVKQMSLISPVKLGLYAGIATMFNLGFYRGCKEYYMLELENSKTQASISDFAYCSIFGLMGASIYVNPALMGFAIHHEYLMAKMLITGTRDENITGKNSFFSFCEKKHT